MELFLPASTVQNERLGVIKQINHFSELQRYPFQDFKPKEKEAAKPTAVGGNGKSPPNKEFLGIVLYRNLYIYCVYLIYIYNIYI